MGRESGRTSCPSPGYLKLLCERKILEIDGKIDLEHLPFHIQFPIRGVGEQQRARRISEFKVAPIETQFTG